MIPPVVRRIHGGRHETPSLPLGAGNKDSAGSLGEAGFDTLRPRQQPQELIVVAQGSPPSLDGFGGHRLGKNGVLHGVSPQRRQICGAGIVVRGIQAVGIGKMSVLQAQDPGLVVHPRHKALHRAAAVNGQGHGGIVAGGQHKSIQ